MLDEDKPNSFVVLSRHLLPGTGRIMPRLTGHGCVTKGEIGMIRADNDVQRRVLDPAVGHVTTKKR